MRKFMIATAAATVILAAASHADATIAIGDMMDIQYIFPSSGMVNEDSGPFTYTGPGQTIGTQYTVGADGPFEGTNVVLNSDSIDFSDAPSAYWSEYGSDWNGPVVIDLTNSAAFEGWRVLSDNVGITGYSLGGGSAGVNWQGAVIGWEPDDVLVGVASVPEPATWALTLMGMAGLGAGLRGRRRSALAVRDMIQVQPGAFLVGSVCRRSFIR
jgi:opacity protein-like surface antigen